MTPEGKNVAFIRREIEKLGGTVRKCGWEGVRGAPDLFVMLPGIHAWIEVKAPKKEPAPHQTREINRMRDAGCRVFIADSRDTAAEIISALKAISDIAVMCRRMPHE